MARMNPKRRLLAKLKAWDQQAHDCKVAANTEALQQGAVKSGLGKFDNRIGSLKPPRENWEGGSKQGKIVDGKFKPVIIGQRSRFAKS